jgi:hypothetical protein
LSSPVLNRTFSIPEVASNTPVTFLIRSCLQLGETGIFRLVSIDFTMAV